VDHVLQGGETNVGVHVTDVRPSPNEIMSSDTKFVALEYDREIHLEIRFVEGRRLAPNDAYNPGGVAMYYFLSLKGEFEVGDVVFRVDCGANRRIVDRTLQDVNLATDGALVVCYYDKAEEGLSRTITAVASSGFASSGPFAFPLSTQTSTLNFFRTLGCTAADTESQIVRVALSNELTISVRDDDFPDDVFDLIVDGVNVGRTPPGGDKLFDVSYLISGPHQACVRVVKSPVNKGSWEIALHGGVNGKLMTFTDGTTTKPGQLADQGQTVCYNFTVPFP
jgi:hypothetical protein